MIRANTERKFLPLYEALASEVRLHILELLAVKPMNVKEIAETLGLSSAIITMHVRKLEKGGLIESRMVRKEGGTHKICTLAVHAVEIMLPSQQTERRASHESSIPVGHYTEFEVHPTCGLATKDKIIGQFDDPRFFLEPERMNARILWFGTGYVEYKIPNYLLPNQRPDSIEFSMEISSEAPGVNENWPSDIHFYLNGTLLGVWTSPGDFGTTRGRFTPAWWMDSVNQYGLLKVIRVSEEGTFIDGQKLSEVRLSDLEFERNYWTLRIAVPETARHAGGLTLYGEGFGNYNQDIVFRVYDV
jgi:predicted transcriptional regulator